MASLKGEKNPNYKTGLKMKESPYSGIYNSWCNMRQRCQNPNHPKYSRYGGRGIDVHPEWNTIEPFFLWAIENGWQKGLTVDRIDIDGDYEPSNCRWITSAKNSRNKSTTKLNLQKAEEIRRLLRLGAKEKLVADEYGVSQGTIWFIKHGKTHRPERELEKI